MLDSAEDESLDRYISRYSDNSLNLHDRSFTGTEWADGTAFAYYRMDYRRAVAKKLEEERSANR
jgi:hypothetical protein